MTDVSSETFAPVFDLIAAYSTVLKTNQSFLQSFRLTNAGVYQIVSHENGADATGPYELTLIHNPGPNLADDGETNRIVGGQTISGSMSQADLDAYEFDALIGDSLFVSIISTAGGPFSPLFDIHGSD